MKITVELSYSQLQEICQITGNHKKGPAIRLFVEEALQLKKREQLSAKFLSGEWGAEFDGLEDSKQRERARDDQYDRAWRD